MTSPRFRRSSPALRQKRPFNKHPFCELMSLAKIGFTSPYFAHMLPFRQAGIPTAYASGR
jgi:hypothetical protein